MMGGYIDPDYSVTCESGFFGISGKENTTGETFEMDGISSDRETVFKIAEILNRNKVSLIHARDVIRDIVLSPFLK